MSSLRAAAVRGRRWVRSVVPPRGAAQLRRSGLLDDAWYRAQGPVRGADVAVDWLVRGRREGRAPNPLFEAEWFDPDGWRDGPDPLLRFLHDGPGRRGVHPLVAPEVDVRGLLGSLRPEDELPLPPGRVQQPITWGAWLALLGEAQRALDDATDQGGSRTTRHWDRDADEQFVRRWRGSALPATDGPLVSVVLPVRNRPTQVRAAIESVRAQTLRDWELVVVDDGSDDETPTVVASYASADPRVRLVRRSHDGVSAARNAGIDEARGRYVAFLDSDNTWTEHFLRVACACMHERGLRAAFAVIHEQSERGSRYRAFEGSADDFRFGNFVDLNVLVVDADLLREVSGFDTSLRRMVDYDLAWRLAGHTPLVLLPFVGVEYRGHDADDDRISVRESLAWDDVVKCRRLVDWPRLRTAIASRDEHVVSVLVPVHDDWRAAHLTLEALGLAGPEGVELEIVVVDSCSSPGTWRLLWALHGRDAGVQLLRAPVDLHRAAAVALALERSTGARVAVVSAGEVPGPGGLAAALGRLAEPGVVAVVPGAGAPEPAGVPADAGTLVVRAEHLVAIGGFDPLLTNEFEVRDACRRLVALPPGGGVAGVGGWSTVRPYPAPTPRQHEQNLREERLRAEASP